MQHYIKKRTKLYKNFISATANLLTMNYLRDCKLQEFHHLQSILSIFAIFKFNNRDIWHRSSIVNQRLWVLLLQVKFEDGKIEFEICSKIRFFFFQDTAAYIAELSVRMQTSLIKMCNTRILSNCETHFNCTDVRYIFPKANSHVRIETDNEFVTAKMHFTRNHY